MTSQAFYETRIIQTWAFGLANRQYAEDHDLDIDLTSPPLISTPRWSDVDDEDRPAVLSFLEAWTYANEVRGDDVDLSDYEVEINPAFGLTINSARDNFVPDDDPSTSVKKEPSLEEIEALPKDEVCGSRSKTE